MRVAYAGLLFGVGQQPTSATSTTSTSPTPIAQYLEGVGVTGEPVPLDKLTDLKVTLPQPAGWVKYSNANLSPATQVIAKNNTYPTATLIIFKLNGNFDVGEAIKHANVDAEISQNFTKLNSVGRRLPTGSHRR